MKQEIIYLQKCRVWSRVCEPKKSVLVYLQCVRFEPFWFFFYFVIFFRNETSFCSLFEECIRPWIQPLLRLQLPQHAIPSALLYRYISSLTKPLLFSFAFFFFCFIIIILFGKEEEETVWGLILRVCRASSSNTHLCVKPLSEVIKVVWW